MYKFLKITVLTLFFISCQEIEHPEFQRVETIALENITVNDLTVKANVLFNNPNLLGGTFNTENITVYVNDLPVGNISTDEDFKVPLKDSFTVPLRVTIPIDKIYKNKDSYMMILQAIFIKKINVRFKGKLIYKLGGLQYKYPIDTTEELIIRRAKKK